MLNQVKQRLRTDEDRGAVMIIFAISLVMLFLLMALAVDTAYAFTERRDSQATADVSALGGALTLIDNKSNDYQKAVVLVDEVIRLAEVNIGPLDWNSCTDPDSFAVKASDVFTNGIDPQYTECISWSSDWSEVRVQMPTRDVPTFFAKVIGVNTVEVDAFAEVGAVVSGGGGVLPFGVLSGGSDGLICLKTGPQQPEPECDPNVSGNFNFLDFRLFGNLAMGTTASCTGGSVSTLKENIAHGIDHDLAIAPSSPIDDVGIDNDVSIIEEDEECPGSQEVQAVLTETGNKQKVIIDGFVNGENGFPGRLTLGNPTFNYNGTLIDDIGLWEYLTPAAASHCGNPNDTASVLACVQDASAPLPIFDDSILNSPRLALVPELWQTSWPSGSKLMSFQDFKFIYLQTIYGGCKNNGNCSLEIEPGASGTKNVNNQDPVVISAIGIRDNRLSQVVQDSFGTPQVVTYTLTR